MVTVGTGEYVYEVVDDWLKLPTGWTFGRVTGVAVDSQDRVHLCQQAQDPPVLVFDPDGNYIRSWGTGSVVEPHTIYVGPDDVLYLADRGAHVASKFTLDGEPLLELGNRGQPSDTGCNEDEADVPRAAGPFNRPTRLFPSPSGDLYVSDGYRNSRVHRFSADGTLISSWGTPGKAAPGQFRVPHCVWVDGQGLVYVADRWNNRIQIFSPSGEFVSQWGDLNLPTDLFMDANEKVYLYCHGPSYQEGPAVDALDNSISVLDKEGRVEATWNTPRSHQIWVDSHEDIYLTVTFGRKLLKYVRKR